MQDQGNAFGPLRNRADLRSIGFIAVLAALIALQWTGALQYWLLLLPTCLLVFIVCIVKHNHIHCRTFAREGWNMAFSLLLSVLTGTSTTGIITAHNERHHAHNNSEFDFVRCSLVSFRRNWMNLFAFFFVSMRTMYRERPADLARWRENRPKLYRQLIAERTAIYVCVIGLLVLDWRATLTYLVGPWLFGQWALVTINLLQHQGCDPDSSHDHSRNVTGPFINWLLLNNGFHTAHHMRPTLHWSFLPAYHRENIVPFIEKGLDHRSLALAIWRQFFTSNGKH